MDLKLNNLPNLEHITNITRVEYIESTGTQYIDTGVTFYNACGIYVDFQYTDLTQQQCVFGCSGRRANNANAIQIALYIGSDDKYTCYRKDTSIPPLTEIKSSVTADLYRHTANFNVLNNGTFNIDTESDITLTSGGGNPSAHTIPIFCKASLTSMSNFASVRIYAFKMYNNGNLIRDFVPAYDKHFKACLYDTINHVCYYNQGSGEFILGPEVERGGLPVLQKTTSLYIKDCPNIDGLALLENINNIQRNSQIKLSRIRLDVGNITKSTNELYEFLSYSGFNDNYEEQIKPRLIGTADMTASYYSDEELSCLQSSIDGLTINYDLNKNVNTLLENNELAIQTLDSTKPNYNPAVAIILNNNNFGHLINNPINQGEGKYLLKKSEAAAITGLSNYFLNKSTVTDTDNIVSPDSGTTQTYDFSNFDEFNLFTGLTTISGGAAAGVGGFSGCSKLTALDIPSNITSMDGYSMPNCSALQSISIPKECISIGSGAFANDSALTSVYYDGTVENWMNITFGNAYANPLTYAHNLYINNELLTSLSIPSTLTSIKANVFSGASCLSGNLVIPNTITSIGAYAFSGCSGLTGNVTIPGTVTSIGQGAFTSCTNISTVTLHDGLKTVGASAFYNCNNLENLILPDSVTSVGGAVVGIATKLNDLYIPCSIVLGVLGSNNSNPGSSANCIGNGLGTLYIKGDLTGNAGYGSTGAPIRFKTVIVCGQHATTTANTSLLTQSQITDYHGYDVRLNKTSTLNTSLIAGTRPKFIDIYKLYSVGANASLMDNYSSGFSSTILHLEYNEVTSATPTNVRITRITKVYLGAGLSAADDTDLLNLYLADTNWSGQSAKLAIWYDYNGEYRTYKVVDNLTNCTNTNPDAWPHITRGESYQTTIVPDEGMTLDSVTVEMLDTDTTSPTYDTYVDVTSSVYNSSTGEININSVIGNVIITASAI